MVYILLIALSLALDAFAVSVTSGLTVKNFNFKKALLLGIYFGGFQFVMPLIGWLLGTTVSTYVSSVAPYISFLLLAIIGGKMIRDARKCENEGVCTVQTLSHKRLFLLAVATSIDALAVGVTFAFMDISIWLAAGIIGAVAFILSICGGMLGGKLGDKFQKRAETIGGLVLIAIGLKILIESFFN